METEECKDESDDELDEILNEAQKDEKDKENENEIKKTEENGIKMPNKSENEVTINEIIEERKMSVENFSPRKLTEDDKVLQSPNQFQRSISTISLPIDPDTEFANITVIILEMYIV